MCDHPDCKEKGEFKAPKNRGLNEHFHFCLEHVQQYNKAWDFFDGMGETDIEDQIRNSATWDRPTWNTGSAEDMEERLKEATRQTAGFETHKKKQEKKHSYQPEFVRESEEGKAMAIMGITPPTTLQEIRTQYKALAKKHHPDKNAGCKKAEERLKNINQAYSLLKKSFENFTALEG